MKDIIKYASHISITDYTMGDCKALENAYTYTENWKKFSVGIVYDYESKELMLFGGVKVSYIQYLTGGLPFYEDFSFDERKSASVRLQGFPRNSLQQKMIKFLIGEGEYQSNTNLHQLSCNAETGEGKTFCAVAMITYFKVKTIIIVNRVSISETWEKEVTKFTDYDERNIQILKGNDLANIYEGKEKKYKDKSIFICVHRTIYNFGEKYGWKALHQVFKILGIGLKIYDEAHREFANTTMIDCYTNTFKTVYLTATLRLSNPKANYIFKHLFTEIPQFNQRELGYLDAKKHIIMIAFMYNSRPSMDAKKKCYNARMHYFNAKEHSMYQVTDDDQFFIVLDTIINKMSIRNNFRTLILVSRIKACEEIANFIKENHNVSVGIFNSSINKDEKDKVLRDAHIIVSTSSSLGESATIDDLHCVINCEAHRNLGDQDSGRLRKPKDGSLCYYCELVDTGFKSITNQWNSRKKHYLSIFKNVIELRV